MDRKKKREKTASNGIENDCQVESHIWQLEAEQQGIGVPSRKVLQCVQQSAHLPNQSTSTPLPQISQQQQAQGGAQQGQLPPGQQPLPYWPSCDLTGLAAGPGHYYLFPVGSQDANSNWHASAIGGSHGSSSSTGPFSYPSGFGFPHTYPGFWDPSSWWAHNAQAPAYPYPFPGYGASYSLVPPPIVPPGAYQRGSIKLPPGLSQKHQRLWEAQSMENVQLWAALARAEGEILSQRSKLAKLEADLQAIKAQQDAAVEASAAGVAGSQCARRGRRRKPASVPDAIIGLPAPESVQARAQSKMSGSLKTTVADTDLQKGQGKEKVHEDREKIISLNVTPLSINIVDCHQEQKSNPVEASDTITSEHKESHVSALQDTVKNNKNEQSRKRESTSTSHVDSIKPLEPAVTTGLDDQSVCRKTIILSEANFGVYHEGTDFSENRILASSGISGNCFKGESARLSGGNNCSGVSAGDIPKNSMLEASFLMHYDVGDMEKSDKALSGKLLPGGYTCIGASEEQDEVVQGDNNVDEADDDGETALDEITMSNVSSILAAESTSGSTIQKEMLSLSGW